MNEKKIKFIVFSLVAALHLFIIFFFTFNFQVSQEQTSEDTRIIRLTDFQEAVRPPPGDEIEIIQTEANPEIIIEADRPPVQAIEGGVYITDYFFPAHQVSVPPHFDPDALVADLVFPPIALRAGIEGRVILELFVDSYGFVQKAVVLQEEPQGRGFGDAAVKVFQGRRGSPAIAYGMPVPSRFRYPVTFIIR
jgi:protein TonB